MAASRRLGYEHGSLVKADLAWAGGPNLAKLLSSPRHPKLKAAFDRGRLLRELERLAKVAIVAHAAKRLKALGFGFETGRAFRDFLDTDPEARDLWEWSYADAWIENREHLRAAAAEGSGPAMRMLDEWFKDREAEGRPAGADLARLSQKEICDLLGVTRVTAADWQANHRMPRNADGSYDLGAVIRWYTDFLKRKAPGAVKTADTLRDLKAEKMRLEVLEQKGDLLDRAEVVGGFVARWQKLTGALSQKRRELASMLHGQTTDGIEQILERFFEDRRAELLEVPEFLRLEGEAEQKLTELLEMIKDKT